MYIVFWIASLLSILGLVAYFVWKSFETSEKSYSYLSIGLFLLLMLWARLPFILVDFPLNVDEAQYLAQALMFLHDPIPWLDIDPTGPLDSWVLLVPKLVGLTPGYASSRIVGIILMWISCIFVYRTLKLYLSESWSLVTVLIPVLFWSSAFLNDFVHYSSELVPMCLISAVLFYLISAYHIEFDFRRLLFAVALSSLVPFAKLQATVIVLPLVLIGIVYCFVVSGTRVFIRRFPWIVLSGVFFPMLILIPVILSGGWNDFLWSYLVLAMQYGESHSFIRGLIGFVFWSGPVPVWGAFIQLGLAFLICVWTGWNAFGSGSATETRKRLKTIFAWPVLPVVTSFVFGMYAIVTPGTYFGHYWQLVIVPSTLIAGLFLVRFDHIRYPVFSKIPLIAMLGAELLSSSFIVYVQRAGSINMESGIIGTDKHALMAVEYLNRNKVEGDRMVVWGWFSDLYIKTGMLSGSREVHVALISPDSNELFDFLNLSDELKSYYRNRFMGDLSRSRPRFIVDVCYPGSFGFNSRRYAPESFSELWEFISSGYDLVFDSSTPESDGIRIWRRREVSVIGK